MITTSIEKLAKDIGFDIGNASDTAQVDLLNGLGDGLSYIKQKSDYEMQCCYIYKGLSIEAKRLIKELYSFIELKES